MKRSDLTTYQKNRFSKARICPLCNNYIFDDEELDFAVRPIGRYKVYVFYHASCTKEAEGYGKEKQEKKKARKGGNGSLAKAVSKAFTKIPCAGSC